MPGHWMASLTGAVLALALAPSLWGQQGNTMESTATEAPDWPASARTAQEPGPGAVRVATVTADRVYVRCGPSRDYYPTGILDKGTQVRVLRQRPDGWVAIEPPEGSYSWVASEFVREIEPGVGEVVADEVPAWIGSDISPLRDHSQISLHKGQRVRIRKKHVFPEDALQRVWLQIDPPEGEVRWVRGEYLSFGPGNVPPVDPSQPPPSGSAVEFQDDPRERPAIVADDVHTVTEPTANHDDGDRANEYALRLFRETEQIYAQEMQKPLGERDILSLKARYKQIVQLTKNPALRKVAQSRLELLEKEEVRERLARRFVELVRRSREKDQHLLRSAGRNEGIAGGLTLPQPENAFGASAPAPVGTGTAPPAAGTSLDGGLGRRWFEDPFAEQPTSGEPGQPRIGAGVRYGTNDGVEPARETASRVVLPPGYRMIEGVLHPVGRDPDGQGRYVVRDPRSGRVLGYVVETRGLNLDRYVGKLVRISGRELRPSGPSGELMARRVEPVRRR